jgi:hypothetical protein
VGKLLAKPCAAISIEKIAPGFKLGTHGRPTKEDQAEKVAGGLL